MCENLPHPHIALPLQCALVSLFLFHPLSLSSPHNTLLHPVLKTVLFPWLFLSFSSSYSSSNPVLYFW